MKAYIPIKATNITDLNSAYDDYNSAEPSTKSINLKFSLIFSSNRNSKGQDFDFVYNDCMFDFNQTTGVVEFSGRAYYQNSITQDLDKINTSFNEMGPYYSLETGSQFSQIKYDDTRFFYTSDRNGSLDIFYFKNDNNTITNTPLNTLNSIYDDGYMCINPNETTNYETVYFTSNRDSTQFDIFRAIGDQASIEKSKSAAIQKVIGLNSSADDKCPYIKDNIMVFTSNRPGGFGGFDLYYSKYDSTGWSVPINFGEKINSSFDEYRPIVIVTDKKEFFNDILLFSSNRPGGMGGFDLYYSGLWNIE